MSIENYIYITNKFDITCVDCKQQVNKKERALYIPSLKRIKCIDCSKYSIIGGVDTAQENAYFANLRY